MMISILKRPNEKDVWWRLLSNAFKSELGVDDAIAAAAADAYWLHYLSMPRFDESKREVFHYAPFAEYANSKEYDKLHKLTAYSDALSKLYAVKLVQLLLQEKKQPNTQQPQLTQKDVLDALRETAKFVERAAHADSMLRQLGTSLKQIVRASSSGDHNRSGDRSSNQSGDRSSKCPPNAICDGPEGSGGSGPSRTGDGEGSGGSPGDVPQYPGDGWGLEPGELRFLAQAMPRLETVIERLETIGNLRIDMSVHIAKLEGKRGEELRGYRLTRNITDAVPHDLAFALQHPVLFAMKLSGGFVARSYATPSVGPLIVVVDKSGSMDGAKIIWASNVALNLALLAKRRNVPFKLLFFDTLVYGPYDLNNAINQLLYVEPNGGTSIDAALNAAIPLASRGTVVMVTDGISDIDIHRINALKRKHSVTLLCYIIERNENADLHKVCDIVRRVKADEHGVLKIVDDVRRI